VLTLTSPTNGGTLAAGATLAGSITTGGAALVALSYAFDGGTSVPVAFNLNGSFSQTLDLSALSAGDPTLVVAAQDAAGNVTSQTLDLKLPTAIPLTVTSITPSAGSSDVGATFRPEVFFSRPIDPTTLNSSNFYATDSTRYVIPATIVPSDDGMSAWLFFTNPLPSSSTITLTVNGSTINASDGGLLDAADNGTPGSTLTSTFATVSVTPVPGTSITGIVADPGPDGQPGTRDDVRAGASGILGTADDIYLNPIAGATVYILGLEDQAVTSGADGSFTLTNIPAGDVKLVIDGTTATNAPSGVYYPEMVFDLKVQPGVTNTVMGDMGTTQQQAAQGTARGVYLPRLQRSILRSTGGSSPTTIPLDPNAAISTLTAQQASEYSITVSPNSLVGMDGQKMSSGMVGVSTVSPSLIREMLPQGVMQLATTLTIQAPGVATFSTPLQVTFANVYGAAAGTKLDVYSFNHTTGDLEITGTATVSGDGKTVTTDPGSCITHPGWFGVTPPGTECDAQVTAGPDPNNICDDPRYARLLDEVYSSAVRDDLAHLYALNLFKLQPLGTTGSGPLSIGLPYANEDDYEVTIPSARLGPGFDPASFLASWPEDMNNIPLPQLAPGYTVDPTAIAASKINFTQVNTFDTAGLVYPGAVVGITIEGYPDKAFVMMTDQQPNYFRFSTLTDLAPGFVGIVHPVSGSREFGYTVNDDGSVTFYTRGLDSPTNWLVEKKGVPAQRVGWSNFIEGIAERFGYSAAEAAQMLHAEDHAVKTEPPCHIGPGGDPMVAPRNASYTPDPPSSGQPAASLPLYWRLSVLSGGTSLRQTDLTGEAKAGQDIEAFVPANASYTLDVYDPNLTQWGESAGVTGHQGQTHLAPVFIDLDPGPIQRDGLPEAATYIIGTNPNVVSTAGDGISDGAKVALGINPLGNYPNVTGVVATLPLSGQAQDVTLVGSPSTAQGQTAYVATGSYGLAVVNASEFQHPVVLGQIQLTGDSTGVAVDPNLQIAAVASGSGLNLVDVSDPTRPKLIETLAIPALAVKISDGVAYAANGGQVTAVDLLSGTVLGQESFSGGKVDDLGIDQGNLYVLASAGYSSHTIYKIVLNGTSLPPPAYSLVVTGHPTFGRMYLFAGGGYVYVGASDNNDSQEVPGVEVIQDTGTSLNYVGPSSAITAFNVTVDSNGLALYCGGLQISSEVGLLDLSDPTVTNKVITTFNTPGTAEAIALAEGVGFVADGSAGLAVLNFLPFDTTGVPPTASISLPASSVVGTGADGNPEVVEGSTLPILATATSNVQVRNVELLVNGKVVLNAVSFPLNLSTIAPTIAGSGKSFTIQVQAYDTGGNAGLSNKITVDLVKDTTPPTIVSVSPADGTTVGPSFQSVQIAFSKPLDPATVTASNFELWNSRGKAVPLDNLELRGSGRIVECALGQLPPGSYQVVINAPAVTDTAGNPLGKAKIVTHFTRVQYSINWINAAGGDWDDPNNWDLRRIPGPMDDVGINVPSDVTITHSSGDDTILSLGTSDKVVLSGGTLAAGLIDGGVTVTGGTLTNTGLGLTLNGNSQWQSGSITGEVVNAGTLTLTGASPLNVSGTLTNTGTMDVTGAATIGVAPGGATINNLAGATFDFQADATLSNLYANAYSESTTFNNAGTLEMSAESGTSTVDYPLNDTGTVEADSGTLALSGGGALSGSVIVGGTVEVNSSITVAGGSTIGPPGGGSGSLQIVSGGVLSLTGTVSAGNVITVAGGTLTGPGTLESGSHVTWSSGEIGGSLINAGMITAAGAGSETLSGTLTNTGTIDVTGAATIGVAPGGATINNQAGATFDFQADATLSNLYANAYAESTTFNNAGTLEMTASIGASIVDYPLNDTGTVQAKSGALSFASVVQVSGSTLTGGTWIVGANSSISLSANITTNNANVVLDGPGAAFAAISGMATNNGSVSVTGGASFTTIGDLGNHGVLTIGPGSILTVRGNYSQSNAATLTIEVAGPSSSGQFGQLNASGTATLDGTLDITLLGGFVPSLGDVYTLLACSAESGQFATINGLTIGSGLVFAPSYNTKSFTLTVTAG
jgi:hypothetical protein